METNGMNTTKEFKPREVLKNIGLKNIIALLLVFLLTVTITCVGGYLLYQSTKESIHLQVKMNAVQSAKEFDSFLLVRENTVMLAGHVVDDMIHKDSPNSEILDYLTTESSSIKKSIDKDYTGLYGWINNEYLDGVGWVPDEDYVPTSRPWYKETIANQSDITLVRPYLDSQTGTVLTTISKKLSDGVSVIALDVPLNYIQEITENIAQETPGAVGIVLDKTGQVVAHSDKSELGKNYMREPGTLGAALVGKLASGVGKEFELSYNGQKYMAFVEQIEGGWHSISLIDTKSFYKPLNIILILLTFFTVLEAIVFFMILYNQGERNLAIASAREAQSESRAKSLFLSQMSHEIRTPINAIIGLDTIALRDESISPTIRDELTKIGSSARHLLSIINDILDMSRIESGRMELPEEVFSFREFIEQINVIVDGQCADKGLHFICEQDTALEEYYSGDSLKLKQVVINILGNSVKFTEPPGSVRFQVEENAHTEEKATLRFIMKDTGIGMDKEYIPKLFEAFSQEDTSNTSLYGGSGLGMAITKNIVKMMDGEIRVESEKGRGTTFFVTLTLGRVKEEDIIRPAEEDTSDTQGSLEGLHILIVEDQEMNAEILADLLELEDMTSEWAENGQRAVDIFAASEPGHFDAILMDMRMPVMDGLTSTREIRKLSHPDASSIPIIALTANAFEEDVKHCLEAGMNAHLSKPVDIDRLKSTLANMMT